MNGDRFTDFVRRFLHSFISVLPGMSTIVQQAAKSQTLRWTNHQAAGKTTLLSLQPAGRAECAARPHQGGAPGAEGPERPPAPQSGRPLHGKGAVSAPTVGLADRAWSSWSLFETGPICQVIRWGCVDTLLVRLNTRSDGLS